MKGDFLSSSFEMGCRYEHLFYIFDRLAPKGEATMTEYEALSLIFQFGSLLIALIFGLLTIMLAILALSRRKK